jgi:hypothetical protein
MPAIPEEWILGLGRRDDLLDVMNEVTEVAGEFSF